MNHHDSKPPSGRAGALVLYSNICGVSALLSLLGMIVSPVTILLAEAAIVFSFLARNDPSFARHATMGLILGIITLVFVALEYMILINVNLALQDPATALEFYKLMEQFGLNQVS